MGFLRYLAMTAGEFGANPPKNPEIGWMACHFSPYTTGLSNLPPTLPSGAMVILSDRTPIFGHRPEIIAQQLLEVIPEEGAVLLDFQRPVTEAYRAVVLALSALPCPVGVPPAYAEGLRCPVFLPPVPLRTPLEAYLRPWKGRELWLEAALNGEEVTVTQKGTVFRSLDHPAHGDTPLYDKTLFCHYRIDAAEDFFRFTLRRTQEDLDALLRSAEKLGITRSIGLWQELHQPPLRNLPGNHA